MPPPIVPVGQSPGKMRVSWLNAQGRRHSTSVNIVTDMQPATYAAAVVLGTQLANEVAGMLNEQACENMDTWQYIGPEGHVLAAGSLEGIGGALAQTEGLANSQSSTVAFLGFATGTGLNEQIAQARVRVYTGSTYAMTPNETHLPIDAETDIQQFWSFLDSSPWAGADFYGRKCQWRPYVALQFNAGLQKKYGA